jgi:hypothetical protein
VFRFKAKGRLREMGLGPLHTVSLADARHKARECRKQRLDGIDLIDARRNERTRVQRERAKSITFAAAAEAYIASHRSGWRNAKHAEQWHSTLRSYAYPIFGELPVQGIDWL